MTALLAPPQCRGRRPRRCGGSIPCAGEGPQWVDKSRPIVVTRTAVVGAKSGVQGGRGEQPGEWEAGIRSSGVNLAERRRRWWLSGSLTKSGSIVDSTVCWAPHKMYDFRTLSPIDFEELVRDLLQAELHVRMESFGPGPDLGIDFGSPPPTEKRSCKLSTSSIAVSRRSSA
jgi:hypothetical protein